MIRQDHSQLALPDARLLLSICKSDLLAL